LKVISEKSIDIHGQHAHQSLVRPETQRQLLDTVADTKSLLDELKTSYQQWQALQQQIDTQTREAEQYRSQLDLLNYQINELESLDLSEDSVQKLIHEQQQLANASQLTTAVQSSLYQLFEEENSAAYNQINSALNKLQSLVNIEPGFANLIEILNSTIVQLDESETELRHYLDHIDLDPSRLDAIETQLSILHSLARKHHVEIEALPAHYQSLCDQLSSFNDLDSQLEQLQQQLIKQQQRCLDLCGKITEKRKKAAKPLAKRIMATIQALAIPAGKIEIMVSPMQLQKFSETGADHIQFLVSTNPGQAAGELGKVASGGELARISLAIQVVTAGTRSVPTLVFDEVDVGIGGGIAEIVGQHLRKLAATQQVICITHLPQVAAQAHHQLQVNKRQLSTSTHIEVSLLDEKQRIEEIARMLGGVRLTEKTRLHAQEMLEQTNNSVV
jgi:DNA repair protein RecN (Recombination protein N)